MRSFIIIVLLSMQLFGTILNEATTTTDQTICSWLHKQPKTRLQPVNSQGHRSSGWQRSRYCSPGELLCGTGYCVQSSLFCDGNDDCGDNSDEENCVAVPEIIQEKERVFDNILDWLDIQKSLKRTQKWGSMVDKKAVIFYFAKNLTLDIQNENGNELAYEVTIQLLSRLHNLGLDDIPSADLASYLNTFLVLCLDPRNFHGLDIVHELRSRVDRQNYTNPYIFLSLCNAGDTITELDKKKLRDAFYNKRRPFWTDIQALSVMALVCASKQPGNVINTESLHEMTEELKQHQYRNGTVEDFLTTALVLQALLSADVKRDPDTFDEMKALNEIRKHQKTDGSFGDITKTYFATPIFLCKSLIDINSNHCQRTSSTDEISALENLANRGDPKIRVQYSLWIGNEKTLERNLAVQVPENMSLYGIMEIAAELDSTYKFEYVVQNRKPYINALSGMRDDPERGRFWFLYTIQDGQVKPATKESPTEIIPKNDDHYVMWYRRGTWNEF